MYREARGEESGSVGFVGLMLIWKLACLTRSRIQDGETTQQKAGNTLPKSKVTQLRPTRSNIEARTNINDQRRGLLPNETMKSFHRSAMIFIWFVAACFLTINILRVDIKEATTSSHATPPERSEPIMPSITLDMKRLEVILSMNATDITYVDASGNHTTHPHMGGKDEHGRWGYVHDETALKRTQPTFEIRDDDDRANLCKSGGTILHRSQ